MFFVLRNSVLTAVIGLALGASGAPARADVITLDVSGTVIPGAFKGNPVLTACSPICTLGGDIVIDNSVGAPNQGFVSADVTVSGESPTVGPFKDFQFIDTLFSGATNLGLSDGPVPGANQLQLAFFTPAGSSLVGYAGGGPLTTDSAIETVVNGRSAGWLLSSGSLTPAAAAVPEPPSLLLLLSALMSLAGLGMVRRYRRT